MTATQECRACATHFPYSEDADYCPTCAAGNAGYLVVRELGDGYGEVWRRDERVAWFRYDETGIWFSDNWSAITEAGLQGVLRREFQSGHGDPYAQHERYYPV